MYNILLITKVKKKRNDGLVRSKGGGGGKNTKVAERIAGINLAGSYLPSYHPRLLSKPPNSAGS